MDKGRLGNLLKRRGEGKGAVCGGKEEGGKREGCGKESLALGSDWEPCPLCNRLSSSRPPPFRFSAWLAAGEVTSCPLTSCWNVSLLVIDVSMQACLPQLLWSIRQLCYVDRTAVKLMNGWSLACSEWWFSAFTHQGFCLLRSDSVHLKAACCLKVSVFFWVGCSSLSKASSWNPLRHFCHFFLSVRPFEFWDLNILPKPWDG